jgi:glucose-fructose oxidoreductase
MAGRSRSRSSLELLRYVVVGIGDIAQRAVLPAFEHAHSHARLVGLVSGDETKRRRLGRQYAVQTWSYEDYDDCLRSENVDAVYLATPNRLHREYAVRAAQAGVHVLSEKPLATTEKDCLAMIHAADEAGVKLMTAYRLHFSPGDLRAMELARSGKLGELRFFTSSFSYELKADNIRTNDAEGGSPAWDLGIYCINAARHLFDDEPFAVSAIATESDESRFSEIPPTMSVVLRFPGNRVAQFTCSFDAQAMGHYQLVGTKGDLRVQPAYSWSKPQRHELTIGTKTTRKSFPKTDQFAAELIRFTEHVRKDEQVPTGWEGLADVRVLAAIEKSVRSGKTVHLGKFRAPPAPRLRRGMALPPPRRTQTVHADSPHH